ncbi:MAG: class I SAM-dependent methyltransferase [Solirubrobacteraceae bacterium]
MTALARQYVKFCDRRDFDDPVLLDMLREILPERDPTTHVERKVWECAMLALFCGELGLLNDRTTALAVGAGNERIVFWLANRLAGVVATDIYGDGGFADREADVSMLEDPASHAPYPYREDHLQVRWMDARELDFPDGSFDLIFSLSAIEHFGAPHQVAAAAREIGRVLRPGGYALITTDCFVRRHPLNSAPADLVVRAVTLGSKRRTATLRRRAIVDQVFTRRELQTRIVGPSGLELMQSFDRSLSPASWLNVTHVFPDGRAEPETGEQYPSIMLRADRSVFTSACLALVKPGTD